MIRQPLKIGFWGMKIKLVFKEIEGGIENGIANMRCLLKKWNVMSRV